MEKKTFVELHKDEVFTDNTKIEYCNQCKNCANWSEQDVAFGNRYNKTCCREYPYPSMKPIGVINNYDKCLKKVLKR